MKERLKELMTLLSVNAADLADRIGVQRSSVSHILNGRNLPSTQFVEKLLNSYPVIDARWLITGHGKPFRGVEEAKQEVRAENTIVAKARQREHPELEETVVNSPASRIEKIVIFYQDRSFIGYAPGK